MNTIKEAKLGADPHALKEGGIYYLALHRSIPNVKYVGKVGDSDLGFIYLFQEAYSGKILKLEPEEVRRSVTKPPGNLKERLIIAAFWGLAGSVVFSLAGVPILEDKLNISWGQNHMVILAAGSVAFCMGSEIASFWHGQNNSPAWRRSDSSKTSREILAELKKC